MQGLEVIIPVNEGSNYNRLADEPKNETGTYCGRFCRVMQKNGTDTNTGGSLFCCLGTVFIIATACFAIPSYYCDNPQPPCSSSVLLNKLKIASLSCLITVSILGPFSVWICYQDDLKNEAEEESQV